MERKENVMSKHWRKYWDGKKVVHSKKMNFYQFEAFLELNKYINQVLVKNKKCKILNAGCGIDRVAYYLNKKFKDKIEITLLDISKKCLLQNKKIFAYTSEIHLKQKDIFKKPKSKQKYDIIYNSGLLEHFDNINKSIIFKNISFMLKNNGYFLTFNPSSKGKLYMKMKNIAEKNNKWEFGEETPITTLKRFNGKFAFVLLNEKDMASMQQIYFLKYFNKLFKYVGYLVSYLEYLPYIYSMCSTLFGKIQGYYILMSVFKKNKR